MWFLVLRGDVFGAVRGLVASSTTGEPVFKRECWRAFAAVLGP